MVVLGVVELTINFCFQWEGLNAVVEYWNLVLFRPDQGEPGIQACAKTHFKDSNRKFVGVACEPRI